MLDLSDRRELAVMSSVIHALRRTGGVADLLLVGAMARDLQLSFRYGIAVSRATRDMDFAVVVPDWSAFLHVRAALLATRDFKARGKALHALLFKEEWFVDLIPFGGVLQPDHTIAWPPDQDPVMSLLGFPEAWSTSIEVHLPADARLQVVSLPALAILKLVAWQERRHLSRGKEAEDLWLLLRNYVEAGQADRLYEEEAHLFSGWDFDLDRAGAWLLGKDARHVLEQSADFVQILAVIAHLLAAETDLEGPLRLASDMHPANVGRSLELLCAFQAGLVELPHP